MKNRSLLAILCFLSLQSVFAQETNTVSIHQHCKDLDRMMAKGTFAQLQQANAQANLLTSDFDLKYHRLEWNIDPAVRYISGTVSSYFQPTTADFKAIHFDLSPEMEINAVQYHGMTLATERLPNDVLKIELPEVIPMGQLDSIQISYQGTPPDEGSGAFEQQDHLGAPIIWTLSEPYGAKEWWPCKQDLNDKIDSIDLIVTVPSGNRVASNGLLISETPLGNDVVFHWKHEHPITAYLVAIAVTNYEVFSDFVSVNGGPDIEILNYVYPEDLEYIKDRTFDAVRMMELFNELFGTYPFADEKYGHAQFGRGGGMEHQTMSFMSNFSFELQSHELAHQWFGNKVTCGSWEDIWLNEGFATYLVGLSYEHLTNEGLWKLWKKLSVERVTKEADGSVWVSDTTSVQRIFSSRLSYSKGALVLHMLRWEMGDAAFFAALKNYLNDPAIAFGYARTADLKAHLEAESGRDFTEFFADWFYGEGYPSYSLNWFRTEEGLDLVVEQTTSHPSVDFFEMTIPLRVIGNGIDTLVRLEHTFSGQTYSIPLSFFPSWIEFDPDQWIISAEDKITAVAEPDRFVDLSISPNPSSDFLNIDFGNHQAKRLRLLTIKGEVLEDWLPQKNIEKLDLRAWAAGVYFLEIQIGEEQVYRKIVKEE